MKIRTLIVGDEYLIVKSLVHILSSMTDRFEVIGTGTDGEQAYSQICSLAPDLVLLDISMPRLDGLELLKRLHDNAIPMPTVIILSAYRNFSYAQQALHYGCREYLLKPFVKRELIEQLTRIADQIEQHRASAAEDQYALLPELLASRVGALLAGAEDNGFEAFLTSHELSTFPVRLGIAHRPEKWSCLPRDIQRFSTLLPSSTGIFCFSLDGLPAFWMQRSYCSMHADTLARAAREIGGAHCVLGVSEPVSSTEELAQQCENIRRSFSRMFYSHELSSPLLYIHGQPSALAASPLFPLHDGFSDALRRHHSQDALAIIYAYFSLLDEKQYYDPDDIRRIVYDCIVYLRSLPDSLSPRLTEKLKRIELSDLSRCQTLDDLFLFFYSLVLDVTEDLRTLSDTGDHCIMLAQNYCRTHLADVTLSDAASCVNMSKNYFCRYFKQHTGENFSDYLTSLRVQTAQDLLHTTNLRIADIAARVGYGTASHFISVFKSACGVTPTEYRADAGKGSSMVTD